MQNDLTKIVKAAPVENRLPAAEIPLPIRAKTGLERQQAGDINSHLVEVESTDGLFTFMVNVIKA